MMGREFLVTIIVEALPNEFVSVLTKARVKLGHSTTYSADLVSGLLKIIYWEQRLVDDQNGLTATIGA